MKIAFCCTHTRVAPWIAEMRRLLPQADCADWLETSSVRFADGGSQADYAVVWAPPEAFFVAQSQLKAVFNIGAGVDALVQNSALPRSIPVVRLDEIGRAHV